MNSFEAKLLPRSLPDLDIIALFEVPNTENFFWHNQFVDQIFLTYYKINNTIHCSEIYVPSSSLLSSGFCYDDIVEHFDRNLKKYISLIKSSLDSVPTVYPVNFSERVDYQINILKTLKDPNHNYVDLQKDIRLMVMKKLRSGPINMFDLYNYILDQYNCNMSDFFNNNSINDIQNRLNS